MINILAPWDNDRVAFEEDIAANIADLLRRTEQPFTLYTVSFLPDLRHRLHQIGLLESAWWNAYDAIAGIELKNGAPADQLDLLWPDDVNFVATPDLTYVYQQDVLFATCRYSYDHYLNQVDYFDPTGRLRKSETYDDRGFMSRRVTFDADQQSRTTLYNEFGQLILTITQDGVQIDPSQRGRFEHMHYDQFHDLLDEVCAKQLEQEPDAKLLVIYRQDFDFPTAKILAEHTYDLVIASSETKIDPNDIWLHLLTAVSTKVVATDIAASRGIQRAMTDWALLTEKAIRLISPYGSDLNLGISNELSDMIVYWRMENLSEHDRQVTVTALFNCLLAHDQMVLVASMDSAVDVTQAQVMQLIDGQFNVADRHDDLKIAVAYLKAKRDETPVANLVQIKQLQKTANWSDIESAAEVLLRVVIRERDDHAAILSTLHTARLLIDLADQIDPFVQLAAISAGVPQLVHLKTQYVTDEGNGRVVNNPKELAAGVDFYLEGLYNWNQALVYNVAKIERFADRELIKQWQEVLKK